MSDGLISRIQRYSTKDGPGIRSTVFLLGCNLKCKWCANPELMGHGRQLLYHKNRCKGCGSCTLLSPEAIRLIDGTCHIDRQSLGDIDALSQCCPYDAYETVGYHISPKELAKKLMRDRDFYESSDGGVTFSGGEAALQAEFVYETARILRKEGIHTALDTAGHLDWHTLRFLLDEIDLVLYDIKTFDSSLHKKLTGVPNELILENALRISALKKAMCIRMIIVPGINVQESETRTKLKFIAELNCVSRVDILPYHKLGLGKYERLGLKYELRDVNEPNKHEADKIRAFAEELGLFAVIGG